MILAEVKSPIAPLISSLKFSEMYQNFMEWDMELIKKWVRKQNCEVDVESATTQYLKFTYLVANNGGEALYVPSPEVDLIAHTHLLFTRNYTDFCKKCAGSFIHHTPLDIPLSEDQKDREKSKIIAASLKHFGNLAIDVTRLCCPSDLCISKE